MSTAPVTPTITTSVATWHIHLFYIILALASWYGTHTWLQEHDARVQAEVTLKSTQTQITSLQEQIKDRDAQAAKQQQVIVKVIHDTATPQQAVAAIPQIVNAPLPKPVTLGANQDMIIPAPDVVQIFDQLADDKLCRSELSTSAADLVDEKTIAAGLQSEVKTLKTKPKFWSRVKHDAKVVGIGVGIGALVVLIH